MPINKKAMAVLTLSSIAFLLAVILFYSRTSALVQGAESNYLGETEMALYNTYLEGEKQLLFIDVAAQSSFRKAGKFIQRTEEGVIIRKPIDTLKANPEQFLKDFSAEFAKYLAEFNKTYPGADLKIEDYTFKIDSNGLIGITEKEKMISATYHNYTFVPNFRVFIETGITAEISYEAVAADAERTPETETTAEEPGTLSEQPEEALAEEINTGNENNPCVNAGGKCRMGCITATEIPFEGKTCPDEWSHPQICCKNKEESTQEEPVALGTE